MIELFGQMRRLGFSKELGFTVQDVAFYEEAMSKLFREEMRLLSRRLSKLPPEQVAKMIERSLPIIHTFLTRYHASRVKSFFESVEDRPRSHVFFRFHSLRRAAPCPSVAEVTP
jgi:flagellar motor switch protein FliG